MHTVLRSALVPLLVLWCCSGAMAWNAAGHVVIGTIAEEQLSENARAATRALLAVDADGNGHDFADAGVWMDDIRAQGVAYMDRWHYSNRAHSPDGTPYPARPHDDDVAWAIRQSLRTLRTERAPQAEKGRALRVLLHTVQDAHNPLHVGSRYTKEHPDGDRGGNDFRLKGAGGHGTLHAFWDAGLGIFPSIDRALAADAARVAGIATQIRAEHPPETLPAREELNPERWLDEGLELLTTFVYETGPTPDPEYIRRGQGIAAERAALAGYRLAALLNQIWP